MKDKSSYGNLDESVFWIDRSDKDFKIAKNLKAEDIALILLPIKAYPGLRE